MLTKKWLCLGAIVVVSAAVAGVAICMTIRTNQIIEELERGIFQPEQREESTFTQSQEISPLTEIDTSDWKTYRNEEYGYEIMYPEEWKVQVAVNHKNELSPDFVFLGPPLMGKCFFPMTIRVRNNPEGLGLKEYVRELIIQSGPRLSYQKEKELQISGFPAYELYRVFAYDRYDEHIYISKDMYVYEFIFPVGEENDNLCEPADNNRIAHQILSTFQFSR